MNEKQSENWSKTKHDDIDIIIIAVSVLLLFISMLYLIFYAHSRLDNLESQIADLENMITRNLIEDKYYNIPKDNSYGIYCRIDNPQDCITKYMGN